MNNMIYIKNITTLELNREKCTGCMMCVNVCPHDVFGYANKKSFIKNKDRCMECSACAMNCPENAINVKSGVGCASAIINGMIKKTEPVCSCSGSCS